MGLRLGWNAGRLDVVNEFHRIGAANGGTDEGQPGVRAAYDRPYSAFLRDSDGNKIEAMTFSAN